jgi:hypothetical protein
MGMDCGAGGAYGILLSNNELPAVVEIVKKLNQIVSDFPNSNQEEELDPELHYEPEDYPGVKELVEPLRQAFREAGINVPESADLLWTGSDDERPARCATGGEDWVLGFGLFTRPDKFPAMDPTFLEASEWHTWVWMS